MNLHKLWLVTWSTYSQQVRARFFILLTLALPLLFVVSAAVPILTSSREPDVTLGWVDLSGHVALPVDLGSDGGLMLIPYSDPARAEAGLGSGEIAGYLVISKGYVQDGGLTYHGSTKPSEGLVRALEPVLRRALAPEAPGWVHARLNEPTAWRFEELESGRSLEQGLEIQLWALMPLALGMVFILLLSTTLNSIGPSVVREKEERSMEMILTSLRPEELVGGKLLGISLLTLTQLMIWLVVAAVCLAAMWANEGHAGLPDLPWPVLGWGALLGVPGYLLYSALAAGLGILAGSREQARQTSGFLSLLAVVPLFVLTGVMSDADGPLAVALSLIPFFSPTVALFRMLVTTVPTWQLLTALALLWMAGLAALWLTARLFRASALMYGQSLNPRHIWSALANRRSERTV
ncbi:MAG: ABC transporter permease [Anaerolineae bacterium]